MTKIRSTGGGGGTIVVPGDSGMTDTFSIGIKATELNAAPSDPTTFRLNLALIDSNTAPTETLKLGVNGLDDTNVAPTDALQLNIKGLNESNPAPSETLKLAIAGFTDSNVVPTETAKLGISGAGLSDSNVAPTETNSALIRVWLSATTMNSTNGVTSPANADGANNGAVATYQSAVAGDANPRTTSALGANVPTIASFTTAVYRGWFKSVNTLATSTTTIVVRSSTSLFADITMFSNAATSTTVDHLAGTFTFDLVAAGVDTLAKLQSMQILHRTLDAAAGVTPAVLTVDAGSVDIQGAF